MAGDLDLAAIADRVAKATPGPWQWTGKYDPSTECYDDGDLSNPEIAKAWHKKGWREETTWHGGAVVRGFGEHSDHDYLSVSPADAEFITHAREDVPALLARIAEVRTHLDWMMAHVVESRPDDTWLKIMLRQALGALDGDRG